MNIFWGQLDFLDGLVGGGESSNSMIWDTRTILIGVGAVLFLAIVLTLWVMLLRKPQRGRSHHHHRGALSNDERVEEKKHHHHRRRWVFFGKRRKRRRREFKRNPSLAQTGGLPPVREEPPFDSSF